MVAFDCGDLGSEGDADEHERRAQHGDNADPVALALAHESDKVSLLDSIAPWTTATPVLLLAGWLDAFVLDMTTLLRRSEHSLLEIGPWSHLGMCGRQLGRLEAVVAS